MIFTPTPQGSLGWIVWLSKDQIKKKRRILFTFLVWDVYVHIDPCTSHGRGISPLAARVHMGPLLV